MKLAEKEKPEECEHDYKNFKQTVRTTNDKFSGTAYFKVKACTKCHKKIVLDYVMEN